MFADRLIAAIATCCVLAFLGIILWWVPRIDLTIVTMIVVLFLFYDFMRQLVFARKE